MKSECVALLLVLSLCAGARAATFYVDDDAPGDLGPRDPSVSDPNEDGSAKHPFDSIQEAIDVAVDGDTIIVAPGHYLTWDTWAYAELRFEGKSIRLVSSAPTDFSVIEQTILCGVVIFDGTEDPNCLLQGFKIQNYDSGGILGNHTQASVSHCIISGNGPCSATVLKDVEGEVRNCLIVDNTTFHDCGVLAVVSGCPTLINCTIANNLSGVELTSAALPGRPGGNTLHNCIIYGNQGSQILPWPGPLSPPVLVDYCLIEGWGTRLLPPSVEAENTVGEADPCFVRWGQWENVPVGPAGRTPGDIPATTQSRKAVLVEGDYHLRSQGWRWTEELNHESHWYYDQTGTSPAIDAGDPRDGLGEELERAAGDPEGRFGFNHAIDLGVYGGTTQASLAPPEDGAPGVGAVDLHDYWHIGWRNRWAVHNPPGTARIISTSGGGIGAYNGVYSRLYYLSTSNAPDWAPTFSCYYAWGTFYMTQDYITLRAAGPPDPPARVQAQYPQYLVVGATIRAPYDPFTLAPVEYRSTLVVRGTLTEVLAGTSVDPNQLMAGMWSDVIAFKEISADGVAGDPIAIFARGIGPLWIAGQPIVGAWIGDREYGTMPPMPTARR